MNIFKKDPIIEIDGAVWEVSRGREVERRVCRLHAKPLR